MLQDCFNNQVNYDLFCDHIYSRNTTFFKPATIYRILLVVHTILDKAHERLFLQRLDIF